MFRLLKWKWILVLIVAITLIMAWVGYNRGYLCSSCWNPAWGDINKEIAQLETKAAAGDPDAAYELSGLYSIYLDDEAISEMWLEKAALLGHPIAKHRIATSRINTINRVD